MRVLVTGGTGYIGSHSVAAIVRAGHRVRILARDPERARRTPAALGVGPDAIELVRGDVTDGDDVRRAVDGCDAVLHAAGVYSFDPRHRARMWEVNVRGTRLVLDAARTAGLDPIIHVSTFGALLPCDAPAVHTRAPVGTSREPYLASKAEAERLARELQLAGEPVVITYPLATLGPHDPHLGDQLSRVRDVLRGLMPVWPTGGFPVGDVRDVARLHAAALEPGRGPRRFLAPGSYVDTAEFVGSLRRVTGRALPAVRLPAALLAPLGRLADLAQRVLPVRLPVQHGAIHLCAVAAPVEQDDTVSLLGTPGRILDDTMADSVRWLRTAGLLTHRQAGLLA
jgi:nucleoside-diphosphate-sugar epimerase